MQFNYTVKDLSDLFPEAIITGSSTKRLNGIASLAESGANDLSFLGNSKYRKDLMDAKAGAILVPRELDAEPTEGQTFIRVDNPSLALGILCARIENESRPRPAPGVHPSAVIEDSATVHPNAYVGPHAYVGPQAVIAEGAAISAQCFVGRGSSIGKGSFLHPRSVVHDYCRLGENVILQPGAVIGGDGFGYQQVGAPPDLVHQKVPQIGVVVIEDDVEIGSNTTIDRARFGETRIGRGTKIDNLVQIAHNVRIGRCCIICAQAGISGSTRLEDFVVVWGQAGLSGHLTVGTGAFIAAQAGVAKDVPPGGKVTGTPARNFSDVRKTEAFVWRLPERFKRIEDILQNRPR